jgi:phage shock protein A
VNKLLDRVEDPRDSLDLSYEKQVENLQKLRRGVAEVATARKRVELQAAALQQQADKLQGQARQALGQGREDLAREALTRRAALDGELAELHEQHDQIAAQEQRLVETAGKVQAQVDAFRTKKETLKATYTAAEAQTKIGEAVAGISDSMGDAGAIMQRAQDKIADMQARAGAIDELLASGALTDLSSSTDDIQAQLDKVAAADSVDRELAALRAEVGAAPVPAGLPSPTAGADPAPAPAPIPGATPASRPAPDQAEVTP